MSDHDHPTYARRACCGTKPEATHHPKCSHYHDVTVVGVDPQRRCLSCAMVGFHSSDCSRRVEMDPVSRPRHYNTHPSGVEVIEVARCMTFDVGNAFKYVSRYEEKGSPEEDLKKARFYIEDCRVHHDPVFVSWQHRDRAIPLVLKMATAETHPLRREFFHTVMALDLAGMAAVVDAMREGHGLLADLAEVSTAASHYGDAPLSGHVWEGDEK